MSVILRRTAPVLTFLAVALLSQPLSASLTVQGTVRFENRNYSQSGWGSNSYKASRYVTVDILRASDDVQLASTFTGASGTYSVTVSSLNSGSSYKVRVRADTAAVKVGSSGSNTWACTTVSVTSTNIAFDIPLSGTCATVARSLNIVDAIVEGYQWAEARAGGTPSQVEVIFPSTVPIPKYDNGLNNIHIPDNTSATNDDVLLHEYGHFLWDNFTLYMGFPDGDGDGHEYCGPSSSLLAFSEAWAHFVFLAVRGKEWGVAYYSVSALSAYEDFETATHYYDGSSVCVENGADNELAVAAVLSDTRDSADETFDAISGQQQKTWDILDHNWQFRSSVPTIADFRTEWANDAELNPLFCKYIDGTASYCPPSTPTASAASNVSSTSFQANWGSAARASGYRIDVSTSSSFSSFVTGYNNLDVGNVVSRSVTGLSSGITYYYRVRAYNTGGTSSSSNTINVTTNVSAPSAPTANAASNVTSSSFQANWGSSAGANGYRVDVSFSNSFSSFVSGYNNLDVGNALSRSVTGLTAGINYYYRVRAYNGGGTSGNSNTINTTTSGTAPSAPTANAASNVTSSSFQANWSAPGGATGYRLDVSVSSSFSSFVSGYNNLDVGNVLSQPVTGLAGGTTYYYRVRAYNGTGTSGNSNTVNATTSSTVPSPPTANSASNVTSSSFQANWNSSAGANGYRLDVSTSSSFSSFVSGYNNLDVGNVLSQSVTGLGNGTPYYYRVRAYNGVGTSGNSNTVSTTTGLTAPSAPTASAASSVSSSSFQANWNTSVGASGYRVDASVNSSFTSFVSGYNNLDVGNALSQVITGLSNGTTYYYRVRAYNGAGTSGNSNTINVTTSGGGGNPAPTVNGVNPSSGPTSGGLPVFITGTNFVSGASVTFGGIAATSISVNSSTSISCTTPAHAAGSVTVVVTNGDAQSGQLSNAFTYTTGASAVYDASLRAPKCALLSNSCDSGALLDGRATLGPEPNTPNTIYDSCLDGTAGSYHFDESLDRLQVSTVDGLPMAPGKQVRIDAWIWAYSEYSYDHLDFYFAPNGSNPSWTYIATVEPVAAGFQQLSTTYTLPSGGALQAVRAVLRFNGSPSPCASGDFDDQDDLVFPVSNDRTLTVASSNPSNGVVVSVTPADSSGNENGTTSFTRVYAPDTVVTLTASASASGGSFQKWQRDGDDWTTSAVTTVTMNADHVLTAIYGQPQMGVPGGLSATYDPLIDFIRLSWFAVADAYDYEIEVFDGSLTSTVSMREVAGYPQTSYAFGWGDPVCARFRVRSVDSSLVRSAWSNAEISTTLVFEDDPIIANSTRVKALHLQQLRTAIGFARYTSGLEPYAYTNAVTPSSSVQVIDIRELRMALSQALGVLGVPTPSWTDPSLSAGYTIKAAHIHQLREATK